MHDDVFPPPDAVIGNRLLKLWNSTKKMFDYHKGTKITKVFEASLFLVSFVHFVVEKKCFGILS